ncbi:glutathione S-transferase T3-like [Humulus lupulus]|uniref:glutathione S-transferase T3-like n=1 Tax=Humulus lupulus TaxID=3486 RepID=UPI002B416119|nr:glutathione S-transferase T3-like [Humulus lupulus]
MVLPNEKVPSQKSKLKWSKEATTLLISGWLNTSKDAIVGNDKNFAKFWDQIAEYFNTNHKDEERRNEKQWKDHWNKTNQNVARFNGCYKRVQQAHHSDINDHEVHEVRPNGQKAEYQFRRRFRMHKQVFLRIVQALENHSNYFQMRFDEAGCCVKSI